MVLEHRKITDDRYIKTTDEFQYGNFYCRLHSSESNGEVPTNPNPNQTRVGDSMHKEGRRPAGRSPRILAWGSEVSGGGGGSEEAGEGQQSARCRTVRRRRDFDA
jgi:hypothetical protein